MRARTREKLAGKLLEISIALYVLAGSAAYAGSTQAIPDQAIADPPVRLAQNAPPMAEPPTVQDQLPPATALPPATPPPAAEIPKPFHGQVSFEAGTGKILTLTLPAANIYVADPKVAEVRPASSTSLFVFGVGAGHTTIAAVDMLGRLLADYAVTVRPSAFGAREAQATIARLIPSSRIQVKPQGKGLMLTGGVANAADAQQAVMIAKGYGGDGSMVDNQMSIAAPTQITVMVRIAEMKRSIVRNLGIDWQAFGFFGRIAPLLGIPGAATHLLQAGFNQTACATGQGCLDATLNALAKDGLAHILAEPNLTVMSGQPASFQAGGEYPYPTLGGGSANGANTVTIVFKPYGVLLNFVATVLSDGKINLHVRPEVSELDTTNLLSVQTGASVTLAAPSLKVRRAETTVELGSGESLAIAGMLQTTDSDGNAGIPGLGDVPVVGSLFKTNNMAREQTELVIIVTPLLVRPVRNVAQLQIPADGYKPLPDFDRLLMNKQVPNRDGTAAPRAPGGMPGQAGFIVR
jgi:pilus assembly protein CpaC